MTRAACKLQVGNYLQVLASLQLLVVSLLLRTFFNGNDLHNTVLFHTHKSTTKQTDNGSASSPSQQDCTDVSKVLDYTLVRLQSKILRSHAGSQYVPGANATAEHVMLTSSY